MLSSAVKYHEKLRSRCMPSAEGVIRKGFSEKLTFKLSLEELKEFHQVRQVGRSGRGVTPRRNCVVQGKGLVCLSMLTISVCTHSACIVQGQWWKWGGPRQYELDRKVPGEPCQVQALPFGLVDLGQDPGFCILTSSLDDFYVGGPEISL